MAADRIGRLAERLWRPLLALAVTAFTACGPAHALGYPDVVFYLVLGGLTAGGLAVPLGLWRARHGLRRRCGQPASRPYVIVFLISSMVVSRWFRTGTFLATGDMGPFIRRGWAPEMTWSWNHQTTGAGSAGYTVARSFEAILIWCCRAVGLTEYSAQWLFYVCIYGLVGVGIAYLAGAFVRHPVAIVAAGAFGVLNCFFLTRLPNPLNIISVGSVALLSGIAMRVALGRRIPPPVAGIALLPTSFLAFNPPMLVVAGGWLVAGTPLLAAVVLGWKAAMRLLWWFIPAAPWAVGFNAWWLVPLAQSFGGDGGATTNADFTDPTSWAWSQAQNTPPNIVTMVANWAWFKPQYLPFTPDLDRPWWIWIRYLLPALVFLAPVLAPRRLRRLALGVLAFILVFVFLAKGLRPPLGGANLFLYQHVPGFWLFREPMSKLGQLLVSFFAIMLAVGVEGTLQRVRNRVARLGAAVPLLLVLAYPYPLVTGGVMPDERPTQPSTHVRVPQEWWDVAERIDADPRPGKVLVLPLDDYYQMPTTWGFFGVDSIANLLIRHPVVQRKPDGYFGDLPGFNADVEAVETALIAGDLEPVPRLLDALGVSSVIVRHDLVRGLPNRYFADDRVLSTAMARVPGARLDHDGTLQLWRVGDGTSPTVRTYDRVLDAPADPDAGAAVIGTVGSRTAIAARAATTPAPASPVVVDSPAVTPDVVQWPVPAVDSGSPVTTVEVPAGSYTVAQRARAAAVLAPRLDPARNRLLLEDSTVVKVDGRPVSRRPTLAVPTPPGRKIIAVRAGTRTVSLDRPRTLPVGASTDLTLYEAGPRVRTTGYQPVSDCNNYEPRPWASLRLSATVTGNMVRLAASDHAACTAVVVREAGPGRTYRVRLQYRHVSGARPQICISQSGTAGCDLAPRPELSSRWTSFERIITTDALSKELAVILHADVTARLAPRTVIDYRDLHIDELKPVATQVVWPPAVPATTVRLTAGRHQLRVDGGPAGSVLRPFEPLEDCFRYDDETPGEAGLAADTEVGPDGEITYTLKAIRHLACIGAVADDVGASSLYELSMRSRSVALREPKYCLYLRGPDRCRTMPSMGSPSAQWTDYGVLFPPDPTAVETRIYLYGLRDLEGLHQTEVEYRGVRLRPVASPSTIVLVRQGAAGAASSSVSWARHDPADFSGSVSSAGPTTLALAETTASGWHLAGIPGAEKVVLQGWMSAWRLPHGGEVTLRYTPARISRYALWLLPATAIAAAAAIWTGRLRRARRRT